MIQAPKCWERGCIHYKGLIQPDETELSQRPVCTAFPEGIPIEIAYGDNEHMEAVEGDHGIRFERD
jgi:hypothetical protein